MSDKIHLGLGIWQRYPSDQLIAMVQDCEALGYDQLWDANEKFYRDPYIGLAIAAMHTKRVRLGTFVADPYTMHSALTAVAIATLDELSHGRAILLMGAGGTALTPCREFCDASRATLRIDSSCRWREKSGAVTARFDADLTRRCLRTI